MRPEPKAAFEAVVDGAFLRINNQSVDADWYHWDFGDGTSSLAYHPEHFYFGNGAFTVTLIAGNTCGADTLHRAFSIGAAPKAGWDFLPHSNCSPLLIHFLDASYSSPDEWQWFFENGIPAQSKERNPSVQFESPGRYEVLQIVSNSYGADTLRRFIEVQTVLTHLISDTLCHDAVVQIEGRVFDKNHPSATWSFKTAQGCDSLVKVDLVFADSLRLDRFLVDRQSHSITLSVSGGIAPYAYRWPDGRGGAVITDLPAGVYRVSVTDQLGCETAFDITVDYTTGTGIVASTEEVYWSPNPAAGGQIMRWKGPAIRRLRCYDVQGNLHAAVEAGAVFKAPLVAGMYLVAAEMLDGTWIWRKLLVQ